MCAHTHTFTGMHSCNEPIIQINWRERTPGLHSKRNIIMFINNFCFCPKIPFLTSLNFLWQRQRRRIYHFDNRFFFFVDFAFSRSYSILGNSLLEWNKVERSNEQATLSSWLFNAASIHSIVVCMSVCEVRWHDNRQININRSLHVAQHDTALLASSPAQVAPFFVSIDVLLLPSMPRSVDSIEQTLIVYTRMHFVQAKLIFYRFIQMWFTLIWLVGNAPAAATQSNAYWIFVFRWWLNGVHSRAYGKFVWIQFPNRVLLANFCISNGNSSLMGCTVPKAMAFESGDRPQSQHN